MIRNVNSRRPVAPNRRPTGVKTKPEAKKPKTGPTSRVPNRVSIHDAARPNSNSRSHPRPAQVRKQVDSWEAAAQSSAMPERLTARTLIGAVIILLVAALLIPTLRGAFDQSQHLAEQRAHLATSQAKSEALDNELARWEDPVFVEAQARSRLGYVRPGDKVWRPIGGETLTTDLDPVTGVRVDDGVVGTTAGQTWYQALLESFMVANGPLEPTPDDLNEILSRNE